MSTLSLMMLFEFKLIAYLIHYVKERGRVSQELGVGSIV